MVFILYCFFPLLSRSNLKFLVLRVRAMESSKFLKSLSVENGPRGRRAAAGVEGAIPVA